MTNPTERPQVTQPGSPFRRALLKTIASYPAPTPRGIRWEPQPGGDIPHLSLELESISDLRRWLPVLDADHEIHGIEVLIEHVDGVVRATSWALWMGVEVRLTAEDPESPGGCEREDAGDVDDLADVALLDLGADYHQDPAKRLAAVAEAAPAFVRPVPLPVPVSAAVVVVDEDQAARRGERWSTVTAVLAAGCPPPAHVDVSEDGWVLQVELPDEAAVAVWAVQLGVEDTLSSKVRKQRGAVRRITSAGRDHPWTLHLACTVDVDVPAAPLVDDIASLAWPERVPELAVAA
jgi:hypothetical protein